MAPITVRIRTSIGTLRVTVDGTTIGDLKKAVFVQHSIPVECQNYSWDLNGDKRIEGDSCYLADCGIIHGSLLFLNQRLEKKVVEKSYVNDKGEMETAGIKLVVEQEQPISDTCDFKCSGTVSSPPGNSRASTTQSVDHKTEVAQSSQRPSGRSADGPIFEHSSDPNRHYGFNVPLPTGTSYSDDVEHVRSPDEVQRMRLIDSPFDRITAADTSVVPTVIDPEVIEAMRDAGVPEYDIILQTQGVQDQLIARRMAEVDAETAALAALANMRRTDPRQRYGDGGTEPSDNQNNFSAGLGAGISSRRAEQMEADRKRSAGVRAAGDPSDGAISRDRMFAGSLGRGAIDDQYPNISADSDTLLRNRAGAYVSALPAVTAVNRSRSSPRPSSAGSSLRRGDVVAYNAGSSGSGRSNSSADVGAVASVLAMSDEELSALGMSREDAIVQARLMESISKRKENATPTSPHARTPFERNHSMRMRGVGSISGEDVPISAVHQRIADQRNPSVGGIRSAIGAAAISDEDLSALGISREEFELQARLFEQISDEKLAADSEYVSEAESAALTAAIASSMDYLPPEITGVGAAAGGAPRQANRSRSSPRPSSAGSSLRRGDVVAYNAGSSGSGRSNSSADVGAVASVLAMSDEELSALGMSREDAIVQARLMESISKRKENATRANVPSSSSSAVPRSGNSAADSAARQYPVVYADETDRAPPRPTSAKPRSQEYKEGVVQSSSRREGQTDEDALLGPSEPFRKLTDELELLRKRRLQREAAEQLIGSQLDIGSTSTTEQRRRTRLERGVSTGSGKSDSSAKRTSLTAPKTASRPSVASNAPGNVVNPPLSARARGSGAAEMKATSDDLQSFSEKLNQLKASDDRRPRGSRDAYAPFSTDSGRKNADGAQPRNSSAGVAKTSGASRPDSASASSSSYIPSFAEPRTKTTATAPSAPALRSNEPRTASRGRLSSGNAVASRAGAASVAGAGAAGAKSPRSSVSVVSVSGASNSAGGASNSAGVRVRGSAGGIRTVSNGASTAGTATKSIGALASESRRSSSGAPTAASADEARRKSSAFMSAESTSVGRISVSPRNLAGSKMASLAAAAKVGPRRRSLESGETAAESEDSGSTNSRNVIAPDAVRSGGGRIGDSGYVPSRPQANNGRKESMRSGASALARPAPAPLNPGYLDSDDEGDEESAMLAKVLEESRREAEAEAELRMRQETNSRPGRTNVGTNAGASSRRRRLATGAEFDAAAAGDAYDDDEADMLARAIEESLKFK